MAVFMIKNQIFKKIKIASLKDVGGRKSSIDKTYAFKPSCLHAFKPSRT
jgi:hypothetical protein